MIGRCRHALVGAARMTLGALEASLPGEALRVLLSYRGALLRDRLGSVPGRVAVGQLRPVAAFTAMRRLRQFALGPSGGCRYGCGSVWLVAARPIPPPPCLARPRPLPLPLCAPPCPPPASLDGEENEEEADA